MFRYLTVCFSLIFFLQPMLQAQKTAAFGVSKINFTGLTKTKTSVLLQRIQSRVGEPIDEEQLIQDVQQLKNFPGIGNVTHNIDTLGNQLELNFNIDEIRTLIPIVNFGGIKGNIWYQLGISDNNFLGQGHYLSTYYQNSDRRHSGQVFFRMPFIGTTNWGFTTNLTRWASIEPLFFPNNRQVNYNYDYNSILLTSLYHFSQQRQLEFGGSYFVENYTKTLDDISMDSPGPERLRQAKWLGKVEYLENFLKYHFFYLEGLIWKISLQEVYNTDDKSLFHNYLIQARYYRLYNENTNLAFRLTFGISSNNDTPFAPFVVDSHVNLRGVGNRIDRGTSQLVLNAEYRRTLFHRKNWASQFVLFTDMGSWRNPGGEIGDLFDPDQFRQFVGGGFRLIYKKIYGAVLRIDYGIDIYNTSQSGIVIGFGQYY